MIRIHLISNPRNTSTALMYAFAQRDDTTVVDEPFYGYYLKYTGAIHPGREEIMAVMEQDKQKIIEKCIYGDYDTKAVFFKNMANHIIDMDIFFMKKLQNVFLIRDPEKLIFSFSKVIENVRMSDIGILRQYQLFKQLEEAKKRSIVIDSDSLLKAPEKILQKLCEILNLTFQKKMLYWKKGGISQDGIWAKYWYNNLHQSTGFKKEKNTHKKTLDKNLKSLYEKALPYYSELSKYEIMKI